MAEEILKTNVRNQNGKVIIDLKGEINSFAEEKLNEAYLVNGVQYAVQLETVLRGGFEKGISDITRGQGSVTDHQGEAYGLLIDQVGEVMKLPVSGREANPANLDRRWAKISDGVHRLDGQLLVVLKVEEVLSNGPENLAA